MHCNNKLLGFVRCLDAVQMELQIAEIRILCTKELAQSCTGLTAIDICKHLVTLLHSELDCLDSDLDEFLWNLRKGILYKEQ